VTKVVNATFKKKLSHMVLIVDVQLSLSALSKTKNVVQSLRRLELAAFTVLDASDLPQRLLVLKALVRLVVGLKLRLVLTSNLFFALNLLVILLTYALLERLPQSRTLIVRVLGSFNVLRIWMFKMHLVLKLLFKHVEEFLLETQSSVYFLVLMPPVRHQREFQTVAVTRLKVFNIHAFDHLSVFRLSRKLPAASVGLPSYLLQGFLRHQTLFQHQKRAVLFILVMTNRFSRGF
jgi:hypothetical protein